MEFRNHHVRIGHYVTQIRGNPFLFVIAILLVPVVFALLLFFGVVMLAGLLLSFVVNSLLSLFGARSSRPARGPTAPESPREPPPSGPVIDVEVVRRD